MKRTKYIILAGTALALAACSAADDPVQPLDTPVAAVIVGGIGDGRSRAANTSWDSDDRIGISTTSTGKTVYANMQYRTSGNGDFEPVGGAATGIFFQDTEEVTFSAYHPFTGPGGTSAGTINDISTADQTRQKQFDYLFAQRTTSHANTTVALQFTHRMTRIVLNISADISSGLTSSDVRNGSYDLSGIQLTGKFNTIDGSATASGNATDNWTVNAPPADIGDVRSYSLIVFPQAISKLTFRASINGKAYSGVFKNLSLLAGTSRAFNISIRKTGLVIGSCTITDRTEGNPGSVTTTVDPFNGHEAVLMREGTAYQPPLYLATCNIGANTPKEAGLYFWWGDIEGHTATDGFPFSEGNPTIVTAKKLITELQDAEYIDDNYNLTPNRDAAWQKWGGSWRMPTKKDMEWLMTNCDWSKNSDPAGYRVKSNSTGGEIFLPATGKYIDKNLEDYNTQGFYWHSTAQINVNDNTAFCDALIIIVNPHPNRFFGGGFLWPGMSIRPVSNYSGDVFKKEETQLPAMPSRSNARIE